MLRLDECIRFHDAFRLFTTAEGCGPGTGFAFCSAALGGRDGVGAPSKCFASTNASGSTTHSAALPRPKDVEPASPSVARPPRAALQILATEGRATGAGTQGRGTGHAGRTTRPYGSIKETRRERKAAGPSSGRL